MINCENCGNPIADEPLAVPNRGKFNGTTSINYFHSTPDECAEAEHKKKRKVVSHTGGMFKTVQGLIQIEK
mgnify:FL=1